ncbi:MAG: DNA-processing protein DprA [Geobacteraceae bacterium]|nr:DNA-processing protein DprA [Geobacteraceae bacterium]
MDDKFWLALKNVPQVCNVTVRRLLEHFGTPERALSASERELAGVKGIFPAAVASLLQHDGISWAKKEWQTIQKAGARLVTLHSPEYPKLLLHLPDTPPLLYVKGDLPDTETAIGIVGSRRASGFGIATTQKMAGELARNGITVVSGMAKGIDAAAHRGALLESGPTIGVLGCGIDVMYPRENRALFAEMAARGALVSEFPMGTMPLAENFPRRNRIISGLCRGILVVEAAAGSGSLITAQCALEQGRDIYAIPGNIQATNSRGTNQLIKQGAKLVDTVEDILEDFPQRSGKKKEPQPFPGTVFSPQEAAIYSLLSINPLHIDEIATRSALTVGEVSAILLRLELNGVISQLPGKQFLLA